MNSVRQMLLLLVVELAYGRFSRSVRRQLCIAAREIDIPTMIVVDRLLQVGRSSSGNVRKLFRVCLHRCSS